MSGRLWKCVAILLLFGLSGGTSRPGQAQTTQPAASGQSAPTDKPGSAKAAKPRPSPLLIEPKTTDEYFRSAVLMIDLARLNLAKRYLDEMLVPTKKNKAGRLTRKKPNDGELLALRDRHGPAVFLRLANIKELQPTSTRLLARINRAFRSRQNDPRRIDALIDDLSGTTEQREAAMTTLQSAGAVAVPRFLLQLGDPRKQGRRAVQMMALSRFGPEAVPPLLAGIDSGNMLLQTAALEAVGKIGTRAAAAYLWHSAFAPNQSAGVRVTARSALARLLGSSADQIGSVTSSGVANELQRIALEHFRYAHPWKLQSDKKVALWVWKVNQKSVARVVLSPRAASLYTGARFAREALALAPERADLQALSVALMLGSAFHRTGGKQPLPAGSGTAYNRALTVGEHVTANALRLALANSNTDAAMASLDVLGRIGTRHQLEASDSSLMKAIHFPNPRVQFAAAHAVLRIDPPTSFRGADRVVSVLARALDANHAPSSVVIDANVQRASTLAGLLREMGYTSRLARTGRGGFRLAAARMDVELIVLHANTIRWGLSQTIANLRADARTAAIPIAIYGTERTRSQVERLLRRHPRTAYLLESTTSDDLNRYLKPFLAGLQEPASTSAQRIERSNQAAYWLARIADGQRTAIYNLRPAETALIRATSQPRTTQNALLALAAIPTANAQRQLYDVATSPARKVAVRTIAADQLASHIRRFGLTLSAKEVLDLERKWRAAGDRTLATALAGVVGSLRPNARRVADRLRKSPPPTVPVP